MDGACLTSAEELPPPTGRGPTRPCLVTSLNGSMPHALLYDLTHDNESYLDKRSAEDALSTGALVAFSYSALGSVKAFDDLYPKLLNLVQEKRRYAVTNLGDDSGISRAKRVLNILHREMVLDGFVEGHVHQENDVSLSPRTQKAEIDPSFDSTLSFIAYNRAHKKDISSWLTLLSRKAVKIEDSVGLSLAVVCSYC